MPGTFRLHYRHPAANQPQILHLAVVASTDGVLYVGVESTSDALERRLADYVRSNAPTALWPADAERVQTLLARGERSRAVDHYFARVGARWEAERLHREVVCLR